jgi:transcriptional regulator with XRE-family HTH domain
MTKENEQLEIGIRLREERERLHLSQPAIAELTDTTKQTQYSYEVGKSPPKASYLAKAASLGVDVGYVITGLRAENVAHTPTELAYLRNCRLLATKKLEQKGLEGLTFIREASGIKAEDMPAVYVPPAE